MNKSWQTLAESSSHDGEHESASMAPGCLTVPTPEVTVGQSSSLHEQLLHCLLLHKQLDASCFEEKSFKNLVCNWSIALAKTIQPSGNEPAVCVLLKVSSHCITVHFYWEARRPFVVNLEFVDEFAFSDEPEERVQEGEGGKEDDHSVRSIQCQWDKGGADASQLFLCSSPLTRQNRPPTVFPFTCTSSPSNAQAVVLHADHKSRHLGNFPKSINRLPCNLYLITLLKKFFLFL